MSQTLDTTVANVRILLRDLDPADYPANPSEDSCQGRYNRCDHAEECDAAWPENAGLHPKIKKMIGVP